MKESHIESSETLVSAGRGILKTKVGGFRFSRDVARRLDWPEEMKVGFVGRSFCDLVADLGPDLVFKDHTVSGEQILALRIGIDSFYQRFIKPDGTFVLGGRIRTLTEERVFHPTYRSVGWDLWSEDVAGAIDAKIDVANEHFLEVTGLVGNAEGLRIVAETGGTEALVVRLRDPKGNPNYEFCMRNEGLNLMERWRVGLNGALMLDSRITGKAAFSGRAVMGDLPGSSCDSITGESMAVSFRQLMRTISTMPSKRFPITNK